MAKKSSGKSGTTLHGGLSRSNPRPPQKPLSGPSVDSEATRKGAAPTPKTLGPRTA